MLMKANPPLFEKTDDLFFTSISMDVSIAGSCTGH